jgi:hypothetical protein
MGAVVCVGGIYHVGPSYVSPSCQLRPSSLITTYRLTFEKITKPLIHTTFSFRRHIHYPLHIMTLHYCALPPPPLHSLHVSPTSVDHHNKDMWHTTSERTCGRPHQQGHVENHVSKYTWNNQMMTSVKRKLAHPMSTSDVRKIRHSGRFTSEVSLPKNVKIPKVLKDEGPKLLSTV